MVSEAEREEIREFARQNPAQTEKVFSELERQARGGGSPRLSRAERRFSDLLLSAFPRLKRAVGKGIRTRFTASQSGFGSVDEFVESKAATGTGLTLSERDLLGFSTTASTIKEQEARQSLPVGLREGASDPTPVEVELKQSLPSDLRRTSVEEVRARQSFAPSTSLQTEAPSQLVTFGFGPGQTREEFIRERTEARLEEQGRGFSGLTGEQLRTLSETPGTGVQVAPFTPIGGGTAFQFIPTESQVSAAREGAIGEFRELPFTQRALKTSEGFDVALGQVGISLVESLPEFVPSTRFIGTDQETRFDLGKTPFIGEPIAEFKETPTGTGARIGAGVLVGGLILGAGGASTISTIRTARAAGATRSQAARLAIEPFAPFRPKSGDFIPTLRDSDFTTTLVKGVPRDLLPGESAEIGAIRITRPGADIEGAIISRGVVRRTDAGLEFGGGLQTSQTTGLRVTGGIPEIVPITSREPFAFRVGTEGTARVPGTFQEAPALFPVGRGFRQDVLFREGQLRQAGFTKDFGETFFAGISGRRQQVTDFSLTGEPTFETVLRARPDVRFIGFRPAKPTDAGELIFREGVRGPRQVFSQTQVESSLVGATQIPRTSTPNLAPARTTDLIPPQLGGVFQTRSSLQGRGTQFEFQETFTGTGFGTPRTTLGEPLAFRPRDTQRFAPVTLESQREFQFQRTFPRAFAVGAVAQAQPTGLREFQAQVSPQFLRVTGTQETVFDFGIPAITTGFGFGRGTPARPPFFLPPVFPGISEPRRKPRRRVKRRLRRQPSFVAAELDIRAATPDFGEQTGLAIRPILN